MWAWQMMMTLAVVVLSGEGIALPTSFTNDRPIIGILAQEVHGSLADALAKIIAKEKTLEIFGLDTEIPATSERNEYVDETLQDVSGELERLELQTRTESNRTATETETALRNLSSSSQESEEDGEELPESSSAVEYLERETPQDDRPIVPVVMSSSVPVETTSPHPPIPTNTSYIGASYVKFVEAGGARVVPIFVNRDRDYYEHILKSINGVLFPGGAVAIDETSAFGRAGKIIYEIAKDMNEAGDVFPLWGTCLGFEMMMGLAANGQDIRAQCDAQNTANRIKLDADYADGYLLRHLPKRLIKALTTQPITANFHKYCLTPKNFSAFGVDKTYRPLAYSADRTGVEYIAAVEARDYPFFAVQFHPEKSPYEWTTKPGHNHIPHSSFAIDTANHFAQVYVNYARRNKHRFLDQSEEESSLIYNYAPVYTGQYSFMEQIYVF